ncbi:MAG TPA: hypothetical protein VKB59_21350 [Micromonosporaceae bacterium]|nr:hypothetical protein [Micromonosporaceae bacterium]
MATEATRNTIIGAGATIVAALIGLGGYVLLSPDEKGGPEITGVSLTAQVTDFELACPTTLRFDGKIDVDGGKGILVYRFTYVDTVGGQTTNGELQRVSVDGAGTVQVADEWTPNIPVGRVFRTATLELLEPTNVKSRPVTIRGTCDASLPAAPPEPPPDVPGTP